MRTALAQNDDLQLAAARVLQAQAQLGITRADQYPERRRRASRRAAAARRSRARRPARTAAALRVQGRHRVGAGLLGPVPPRHRIGAGAAAGRRVGPPRGGRRPSSARLPTATSGCARSTCSSDIAQRTLASRQESLQLTQVRESGGVTSLVDVRQAEQLVFGAGAAIADLERRIAQQENFISVLLGNFPSPIDARPRADRPAASARRPGRPAVGAARAAARHSGRGAADRRRQRADWRRARANYFPSIALTGTGGVQSTALAALFGASAASGRRRPAPRSRSSPPAGRARRSRWPRRAARKRRSSTRRRSRGRSAKSRTPSSATRKSREFREQQASSDHRRAGRPSAGRHPLPGRRDQLSRGARRRYPPVRRRARARRCALLGALCLRRALSRAGRRLAAGGPARPVRSSERHAAADPNAVLSCLAGAGSSPPPGPPSVVALLHTLGNTLSTPPADAAYTTLETTMKGYTRSARVGDVAVDVGHQPEPRLHNEHLPGDDGPAWRAAGTRHETRRPELLRPAAVVLTVASLALTALFAVYQITPALVSMAVVSVL